MPDKPIWCGNLEEIISELRSLPYPWIDRATLERVLQVGRRRAQQILQPCARIQVGSNSVAEREELIDHLRQLASGDSIHYERRRRERLAQALADVEKSWSARTRALVEAPSNIVNQELANLPSGVRLCRGQIIVEFSTAVEALQKLLAIAMAAGNDLDGFERLVEKQP
jgi:hypothetical protein